MSVPGLCVSVNGVSGEGASKFESPLTMHTTSSLPSSLVLLRAAGDAEGWRREKGKVWMARKAHVLHCSSVEEQE